MGGVAQASSLVWGSASVGLPLSLLLRGMVLLRERLRQTTGY